MVMLVKNDILTSKEVMDYLRISKPTLYRIIRAGDLKAQKVGRNYRFLKRDVEEFVHGQPKNGD